MRIEKLLTRPHAHDESHEGVPAWMATFADLSILLLTFFVVLLSFANMDVRKFREMLGSVRDAFGVEEQVRRATTTTASVLAPRLMAKLPRIGQCSTER